MRICLADSDPNILVEVLSHTDMPILYSFFYGLRIASKLHTRMHLRGKTAVYLDSGVFSARKRSQTIDADELIAFYHAQAGEVDWVLNNDQGSPEEQLATCRKMKDAGVPVIGIYHGTMPLDYISRFADISPYVAVSFFVLGVRQVIALSPSNPSRNEYLDSIFAYVHRKGLWPLRLHALGTEQGNLLMTYPFYSCDATGYASDYMFRKVTTYDVSNWQFRSIMLSDRKLLGKALAKRGFDAARCSREGFEGRVARALVAARARQELQEALTKLWASRGITWDE